MNNLNLPEPIAAYFAADGVDGRTVASCFTSDGIVTDENQTYVGPVAIEAWRNAVSARFAYSVEPMTLEKREQRFVVLGRVTGDFPGSPVDLQYAFSLEHDKISSLEIKP